MKRSLFPLSLIPDKKVSVIEHNPKLENPAACFRNNKNGEFRIEFNNDYIESLYKKSLLYKKISFDEFKLGFCYHEVFHIEFDSFLFPLTNNSHFFHFIHNVLLDSQIEYQGAKKHPDASMYIRWCLASTKRNIDTSALKNAEVFIQMKNTFFQLVRFGIVANNSDKDFVNFLLPIILSSMRNGPENVMRAAEAIFEYFYAAIDNAELRNAMQNASDNSPIKEQIIVISEEELEELNNSGSVQIIENGVIDIAKDIDDALENNKLAGKESVNIQIAEADDEFYRMTVAKYKERIEYMRNRMLNLMNEITEVSAYDGNLNLEYQQRAYINSMTMESSPDYTVYLMKEPSVDFLLARDISGSTSCIRQQYAELTVCFHAALQDLQGFRDGHFDFDTEGLLLLNFDESIRKSRIYPRTGGGTALYDLYKKSLDLNWRSKEKIFCIVTDGIFGTGHEMLENELKAMGIKIFKFNIDPGGRKDKEMIQTSIDTFHLDILNVLEREISHG